MEGAKEERDQDRPFPVPQAGQDNDEVIEMRIYDSNAEPEVDDEF
jgi:hypothetical protein